MRLYSSWVSLVAICFVSFVFFAFGCSSDNATTPVGGDLDREVGADVEEFDTEVSNESDLEPAEEQDVVEEVEQAEESDFEPSDENRWNKLALHLDDPIQQGDVIRTAIDRPMLAANSTGTAALTAFGWDSVNADEPYVWHVDLETGVHQRIFTTGDAFAAGENFCMDEDWCQFIGYDPTGEEWLILGPQSFQPDVVERANRRHLGKPSDRCLGHATFQFRHRLQLCRGLAESTPVYLRLQRPHRRRKPTVRSRHRSRRVDVDCGRRSTRHEQWPCSGK